VLRAHQTIYLGGTRREGEAKLKPIKTLDLAALAILVVMAFTGTSSATAGSTSLCEADESSCAAKNIVTHPHAVTFIEKAQLLSSTINLECDALILGDALAELASPLVIHGSFTYSNCNSNCTVVEENGPAGIEVLKLASELASVVIKVLIHMTCSGFINCRYKSESVEGHGLGPLSAIEGSSLTIFFSEQTMSKESGALCPSTAKLDLTLTQLEATYISS
jgi:hypothetical protein